MVLTLCCLFLSEAGSLNLELTALPDELATCFLSSALPAPGWTNFYFNILKCCCCCCCGCVYGWVFCQHAYLCPHKAKKRKCNLLDQHYSWLWTSMWVLRIELGWIEPVLSKPLSHLSSPHCYSACIHIPIHSTTCSVCSFIYVCRVDHLLLNNQLLFFPWKNYFFLFQHAFVVCNYV